MSEPLEQELTALENALLGLRPLPAGFNRDGLLFAAGQRSVGRRGGPWPWAAGLMTSVAAALAVLLFFRPAPVAPERVVYVPVHEVAPPRLVEDRQPLPEPP